MKPKIKLTGTDGNIFSVLGKCTKELRRNGMDKEAKELSEKIFTATSYNEALAMCMQYVDVN